MKVTIHILDKNVIYAALYRSKMVGMINRPIEV